jgi:YesN/AraC family two-component response regulator
VPEALRLLDRTPVDLVITDLRMPEVSGLDLIRHVRANFRETAVIMITGYASIESAVSAVKEGAEEYLPKPFTDEELLGAVRKALQGLEQRRALSDGEMALATAPLGLIGESRPGNARLNLLLLHRVGGNLRRWERGTRRHRR